MQICWDLEIKEQRRKIAIYKHFAKVFASKPACRTKPARTFTPEEIEI